MSDQANEFPVIAASEPVSIETPAVPASTVVYDRWWMVRMNTLADDPNAPARVVVKMVRGRKLDDGAWELSPRDEDAVRFVIPDLFALAARNMEIAQIVGGILQVVSAQGMAQGVL